MKNQKNLRIAKIDRRELEKLEIASGFTRWFMTNDEKSKEELKQTLRIRLAGGSEIWAAITNNTIIGFAIITEWTTVPGIKILDAVEVVKQCRNHGVGTKLLNHFFQINPDTVLGLLLYSEPGKEDELKNFYRRLGFKMLSEGVMIRIPASAEKIEMWTRYLTELRDFYDNLLKAFQPKE